MSSKWTPERIIKIVQAASVRNDLIISLLREQRKNRPSPLKLKRLKRDIEYYDRALLKLRKGQTFFLNASSFANVEILTIEYLKRLYNGTLELHEFKKVGGGYASRSFAGIYVSMCCLVKDISIITVPCLEKPLTARGNSGTCTMIKRLKAVWTSVICFLW